MQAPQAHQACASGSSSAIILAAGTSYNHHDKLNSHDLFVWKPLRTKHCGQGRQETLIVQVCRYFTLFSEVPPPCLFHEHHILCDAGFQQDDVQILGMILQVEGLLIGVRQVVLTVVNHLSPILAVPVLKHNIHPLHVASMLDPIWLGFWLCHSSLLE